MIEMALNAIPPQKIAENLNRLGVFTPKGKYWSGVTIQRLLIDETHLGKIISNKTEGDGHKNKCPNAKALKVLPRSEWVIIENCHEAVKTKEEHDKIIEFISSRKLIATKARHQSYSFSGLIKCERCGHGHSFYLKRGIEYMKPCWYKDPFGEKCQNAGVRVSIIENMVITEIRKYKVNFLTDIQEAADSTQHFETLIKEKETLLLKQKKALSLINDAYEMGDYSREEWIKRKRKREIEIQNLNDEIYVIRKQSSKDQKMTNNERLIALTNFFDNIVKATTNAERNDLYRIILESIIWYREGENIRVKINFK